MLMLFSSASATFGAGGQANYAAANAVLDAAAVQCRAAGLPAQSLAWGFWEQESGMTAHLTAGDRGRMERGGMLPLSSEEGLALFDAALQTGVPALVPAKLVLDTRSAAPVPPLLQALVRAPVRRSAQAPGGADAFAARLAGLDGDERRAHFLTLVRAEAAIALGHAGPAAIAPDRAFKELGFDSMTAVELRNRLLAVTGLKLPATLVFDHPSPVALAAHLDESAPGGTGTREPATIPALAELARLEAALSQVPPEHGARGTITARLKALLASWNPSQDDASGADYLTEASDEELFQLVDNRFDV
jgi:acyl carrier protein